MEKLLTPRALNFVKGGAVSALALSLSACGLAANAETEDRTITMIVTESAPYQEPTEIVKEKLADQGWTLDTTYVTDIILPNNAVQNGEYDVNFFQHQSYLKQFNEDNSTEIEPMFSVYYGRSGYFSTQYDSLEDLPDGARISIPVDTTNNGRALALLAYEGIIEVDDSVIPTRLSQRDITANPKNLKFIEVDQQSLGQTLTDVDAGFGFTRLIQEAGYDLDEITLALEEDEQLIPLFTVVVAAPAEFRDSEAAEVLQEAYQSPEVEEWFENYQGGTTDYVDDITLEDSAQKWQELLNSDS